MRGLSTIVRVLTGVLGHRRQNFAVRCRVAPKLVGYEAPWCALLPLQELAKEPFGRMGIQISLNQDIDHVPVLVYGAPQIVPLPSGIHEDLVQLPYISQATAAMSEGSRELRAELPRPLANSLVGDENTTFGQKVLDVSETQTESVIQPHCVTDDLRRESVSMLEVRSAVHHRSLAGNDLTVCRT